MRLPKLRQLTDDQKKVYLYAPTDKHVLVNGPPGSGKTLIACLRAIELQKKKVPVVLCMFNKVLAKYSSNASEGEKLPAQTVNTWFRDWWMASGLPPCQSDAGKIAIQVDFSEKSLAKAAGARWNAKEWRPWESRTGVWMVDADTYFENPQKFSNWRLWHFPPSTNGTDMSTDWERVASHIAEHHENIRDSALDLGTLLVDEGQDFPPEFYKVLRLISALALSRGERVKYPLRCFVLADENQQLTEANSTLEDISTNLKIDDDNRHLLLDNFRNSKEVAELARAFFADVGALPKLPTRTSEKPTYVRVNNQSEIVQRIKIWVTNNPGKEVGVFVFDEKERAAIVPVIQKALEGVRGRSISIQTYSWGSRKQNKVDDLKFDEPDVVTVLNVSSCKGLEFDAVFIINLHQARIGIYGVDRFKMQMFVAVSRSRDWVSLIESGSAAGTGPYYECLPSSDFLNKEIVNHSVDGTKSSSKKNSVHSNGIALEEVSSCEDWEPTLRKLGLKVATDKRSVNGALWVSGGKELRPVLEPLGFQYSEKRDEWWIK